MASQLPKKAGLLHEAQMEGTDACLKFGDRPSTPENIRKYRKSYFSEPGRRIVHSGMIDDLKNIDPLKKFGTDIKGSEHVKDVFPNRLPTDYELTTEANSEAIYRRNQKEPLGKSYQRGVSFHNQCQENDFAFGLKEESSGESAKEIIYPKVTQDEDEFAELYRKSHGRSEPGEQVDRQYNWSTGRSRINPSKHIFGVKDKNSSRNEVSRCLNPELDALSQASSTIVAKQVEDMKDTFSQLGKVRNLGHGERKLPLDHVYGIGGSAGAQDVGARRCIQGEYTIDQQQPDADLGKPVSHGWRNITTENRAFGVPSIRSDIAPPEKRSVADNQNYGDDVTAEFLLYPDEFAASGVGDEAFSESRTKEETRRIFSKIGYILDDQVFELVWKDAVESNDYTPKGCVSIEEFRNALNMYVEAKEEGQVERWFNQRV